MSSRNGLAGSSATPPLCRAPVALNRQRNCAELGADVRTGRSPSESHALPLSHSTTRSSNGRDTSLACTARPDRRPDRRSPRGRRRRRPRRHGCRASHRQPSSAPLHRSDTPSSAAHRRRRARRAALRRLLRRRSRPRPTSTLLRRRRDRSSLEPATRARSARSRCAKSEAQRKDASSPLSRARSHAPRPGSRTTRSFGAPRPGLTTTLPAGRLGRTAAKSPAAKQHRRRRSALTTSGTSVRPTRASPRLPGARDQRRSASSRAGISRRSAASSFDVEADGSVVVLDEANKRLLRWRGGGDARSRARSRSTERSPTCRSTRTARSTCSRRQAERAGTALLRSFDRDGAAHGEALGRRASLPGSDRRGRPGRPSELVGAVDARGDRGDAP